MFFGTGYSRNDNLARMLGCRVNGDGAIAIDMHVCSSVKGVFVAGDAAENVSLAIVAAAEGAKAAVAINEMLSGLK